MHNFQKPSQVASCCNARANTFCQVSNRRKPRISSVSQPARRCGILSGASLQDSRGWALQQCSAENLSGGDAGHCRHTPGRRMSKRILVTPAPDIPPRTTPYLTENPLERKSLQLVYEWADSKQFWGFWVCVCGFPV